MRGQLKGLGVLGAGLLLHALSPLLPPAAGATLLWFVWIAVPGLLWAGGLSRLHDPARWLLLGLTHLLLVAALWQLLAQPASALRWLLPLSWLMPLLWRRRAQEPTPQLGARWLLGVVVLLALWMALRPATIPLFSDGPAHLAAIREAVAQDRLRPYDHAIGAPQESYDPRFGILHGLYAGLALHGGWDAAELLRWAPLALAPLWLCAHAALFALFLGGRWLPILIALLFTIAGADGRLYGLWSVGYPGNFALACGALGIADAWRQRQPGLRPRAGELLLAASVFVHPFAWWGGSVVLLHAALWRALATRLLRRPSMQVALRCLLLGALAALPLLLQRGASAQGPHAQPVDVVLLGESGLFFCDPFRVMRWGGALAPWLLPILLLGAGRWLRRPEAALLVAAPLSLWTVAFDPLVQSWIYPLVGYLSERLGRLGYAEVVACVLIARPWTERYRPRRRGARLMLFVAAGLGLWMFGRSLAWANRVVRADPARFAGATIDILAEQRAALAAWPQATLLTDPHSSYALAAQRPGRYALQPLAHTSPNDRGIEERLRRYRQLLDPYAEEATAEAALRALDADLLLVLAGHQVWLHEQEFGFVPSDEHQARLLARLRKAGNEPLVGGEDWALFATDGLRFGRAPYAQDCMLLEDPPAIARGSEFELAALQPLQQQVARGGLLEIELVYRVRTDSLRARSDQEERVFLRLQGEMPQLPGWLAPIGKPIRKLLIERRGASERRFGGDFLPFDGYREPASWSTGYACERVTLRVPPHVEAGEYGIQATIHGVGWRPRYDWRDLLSDSDRYSSVPVAYVEIVDNPPSPSSPGDGSP